MIEGISPVSQALLGTLLTWGLTALGAAVAIFIQGNQVRNCFFFFISLDDFRKKYVMYSRIYFLNFYREVYSMAASDLQQESC